MTAEAIARVVADVRDGRVQAIELGRYRFDRIPAAWPSKLERGRGPWEGIWPTDTFTNDEAPF